MIYEENGKIIVDELRPMSEAPRDGEIILIKVYDDTSPFGHKGLREYTFNNFFDVWHIPETDRFESLGNEYKDIEIEGWIHMPEYRRKE